jgi:hypothetical protein
MKNFRGTRLIRSALLFLCGINLAVNGLRLQAQILSPVRQEFNKKARGSVEVANIGDTPKVVSCRMQGFDADEHGVLQLHPIGDALHVRISAERVVLAPKGSRQISFDADPAMLPAWFAVTCRFMPVERGAGLTVAMEISSLVIVQGGHLDPRDVTLSAKHVGGKVLVEVKNNGSGLAQVSGGAVRGHRKQVDLRDFTLFPHQTRLVEADWKETTPPESTRLQIGKKRLEAPVN